MNTLYSTPVLACYANDNDALIPELWAQEGLAILEENMVMARLVHRDFSMEVANFGDVVNTRRPNQFAAARKTDADDVISQDAVATNVQVPLDQHVYVTFTIKDGEASKSFQDLVDYYLSPAAQEMASSIDRILCGQVHEFLANRVGGLSEMTESTAKSDLLETREKMNVNKAYAAGRNLVLSPQAETELLKTELFISAEKRGDDGSALRDASLGRVLGFDTYMDQNVPYALLASTDYVAGETQEIEPLGETTINCLILSYQVIDGEFVTVAGEAKPHVVSSAADDGTNTNSVVLVSGLESAVAANAAVTVWKAHQVDNASGYPAGYSKQVRLESQGAGGNAIQIVQGQLVAFGIGANRRTYTVIGVEASGNDILCLLDRPLEVALVDNQDAFPGPSGSFNFAFHRNALAFVSRPLALPNTALGVRSSVGAYNDVAMRVSMQYDITSQGTIVTLDLLCGVATLDTNLGCVLLA
jgi:hypothetical protein